LGWVGLGWVVSVVGSDEMVLGGETRRTEGRGGETSLSLSLSVFFTTTLHSLVATIHTVLTITG
jgi:hypothetical protein